MNALDLYRVIAPVVAYTKEGHSAISISDETSSFIKQNYSYFPFLIKILEGKAYIIHNIGDLQTKEVMPSKIKGDDINTILQTFYSTQPADGYNITSKYHWMEGSFSRYYTPFFTHKNLRH